MTLYLCPHSRALQITVLTPQHCHLLAVAGLCSAMRRGEAQGHRDGILFSTAFSSSRCEQILQEH